MADSIVLAAKNSSPPSPVPASTAHHGQRKAAHPAPMNASIATPNHPRLPFAISGPSQIQLPSEASRIQDDNPNVQEDIQTATVTHVPKTKKRPHRDSNAEDDGDADYRPSSSKVRTRKLVKWLRTDNNEQRPLPTPKVPIPHSAVLQTLLVSMTLESIHRSLHEIF